MPTMLTRTGAVVVFVAIGLLAAVTSNRVGAQGQPAMELDVCPSDYMSIPKDAPPIVCGCSAAAVKTGNLYGTNPYMNQSSPCRAALHAGAIGPQGGKITIKPEQAPFFPAVNRNGVSSGSFGASLGFRVVVEGPPATQSAGGAGGAASGGTGSVASGAPNAASGMELDVCPSDYMSIPGDAPPITCGCSAAAVKTGNLYGTNPYMNQSSPCRAALHAGAIGLQGGKITIKPERAPFFPAVTRNGTSSGSFGASQGFRVVVAGQPATTAVAADGGMELDVCPSDYMSIPEDAPPITCGCSAAAVKTGNLYGTNPYMNQSAPCRAGLHAGVIGSQGGKITLKPERAPFFPAVTRNGTSSGSFGASMGFRVVAAPGTTPPAPATPPAAPPASPPPATQSASAERPSVDMTGKPIQAPVAKTLRETGRVQLYVNFATDKEKPLPSSEPVLQELLAALQGDGTLRVMLIGHTDNQGGGPYNLDLSQRRAAAVYLWLIQHGIDSDRLRSDGRGLMEPIADNSTEWGRALNRRVEVKAIR
jgi:outer membrane protein OmpA-like peptidoglycan-associated protein